MTNQITKKSLVEWISKEANDCGKTDYFGYKMKIEDFEKEMNKKKKLELENIVFNWSEEGQKYLEKK